ncbi:MAG: hypothetical protein JWN75_1003 [Candidatus Saccharibacteria bacterium]|nr:hypothetical protein [Candidatus Saccharibacteria bacterium]
MSVDSQRGFTIIEVMLFLAITGGLFAALMVGVNTGITQQRYLDSVRSYKALVQNQYSEVLNTRNDNAGNTKCSDRKDGNLDQAAPLDVNGTSQCVILGRAIKIMDGGTKVETSSVTAYDMTANSNDSSDITVLTNYKPKLSSFNIETTEIDWQGNLEVPASPGGSSSHSSAFILILRSPTTGNIRLFTSPSAPSDLSSIITDANAVAKIENCMKGDSGLLPKQSITIDPRIASPDAVSTDGGGNPLCQ